jgi:hypothetical protein
MTKTELRVLQLLTNNGGRMKRRELSPQMSRYSAKDRERALGDLETLELVSSAQVAHSGPPGGVPGLVYFLTKAGRQVVKDLQATGELMKGKRSGLGVPPSASRLVVKSAKKRGLGK